MNSKKNILITGGSVAQQFGPGECEDKKNNLNKKFNINLRTDLSLIALQGPKSEKILVDLIPEIKRMEFMSSSWFRYKNYEWSCINL